MSKNGLIYFMVCWPLRVVKIGYTKHNPRGRMSALQTGCPGPLEIYGTVPGTQTEERLLHEAFDTLHIHGEWFHLRGKLHDLACYLSDCKGRHPADRESFECGLHDVLFTGLHYPDSDISEEEYQATGNWRPLAHLIPEALDG